MALGCELRARPLSAAESGELRPRESPFGGPACACARHGRVVREGKIKDSLGRDSEKSDCGRRIDAFGGE